MASNPEQGSASMWDTTEMNTFIQICQRRTEREADKVVARRVEQISTMGRVDVEEDSGDHDCLFLQKLFKESLFSA